jgi:hypothetical protein
VTPVTWREDRSPTQWIGDLEPEAGDVMKNRFRRIFGGWSRSGIVRAVWIFVLATLPTGTVFSGGTLTGVRLGLHPDHTRVVFDCRGAVQAGDPFVDSRGVVLVPFPGADVDWDPVVPPVQGYAVTAVEVIRWPSMPVARIQVAAPLRDVRIFRLTSPDRVILDLFTAESSARGVSAAFTAGAPANAPSGLPGFDAGGGLAGVGRGAEAREAIAAGPLFGGDDWNAGRSQTAVLLLAVGLSAGTLLILWSLIRRDGAAVTMIGAESTLPAPRLRDIDARIRIGLSRLEGLNGRSRDDDA